METIPIKIIPIKKYYVREEVKEDSEHMYIFTDNWERTSGNIPVEDGWYKVKYGLFHPLYRGNRTQAIIRGLNNAYPISTMINGKGMQMHDYYLNRFKNILNREVDHIKRYVHIFKGIKYNNEMQFGDGQISNMKTTAPLCWEYLNTKLLEIGINNVFEN